MVIFSYTGSPQVKISQKVLGGLLFLTRTVHQLRFDSSYHLGLVVPTPVKFVS